jgi:mono/diheme cytochrome c family protein
MDARRRISKSGSSAEWPDGVTWVCIMRWFLLSVFFLCGMVVLVSAAFIVSARGFSAREQPTGVERWIAGRARAAALPAQARDRTNPIANTPEVLAEARAHWADHCASCHANDGSGDTPIGKRLYPPSPDMRQAATQEMTDGALFFIIQNGIRLSGMPAWSGGSSHDEEDSWKLVRFIRHLPQLTTEEKKEMEKLNPKSPDEIREEEQEEKFLKGEESNEPQIEHHHH